MIKLASWMYGVHPLTAADAHTIEVKTIKGVTYVPIPQGTGDRFAGLFTVDLPQTVKTGQEFDIVVRRIGKRLRRVPGSAAAATTSQPKIAGSSGRASRRRIVRTRGGPRSAVTVWQRGRGRKAAYERYIVGSFQVKIPVSTREAMLPAEETTLAILKARLEAMPKTNRWYPVLLAMSPRSPDGWTGWRQRRRHPAVTGRLSPHTPALHQGAPKGVHRQGRWHHLRSVRRFPGFILDTEDGNRRFTAREPEIERVVHRAWASGF